MVEACVRTNEAESTWRTGITTHSPLNQKGDIMRALKLKKLQPSYFGKTEKKVEPKGDAGKKDESKGNAPKVVTADLKPEQVVKDVRGNGKK